MAYHAFKGPEGDEYGSFETFELGADESPNPGWYWWACFPGCLPGPNPGWYWWACFPGCLPDSDPFGPFATEQEAIDNAQKDA